jgi:hypothetical protein
MLHRFVQSNPELARQSVVRTVLPAQRSFSTLKPHSKKKLSTRIGKVYRNFFGCIIIVPEKYALMLHRMRKFNKQLEPGLNFCIPFIDTVEYIHDLREQAIEVHSQVAVTKDNV